MKNISKYLSGTLLGLSIATASGTSVAESYVTIGTGGQTGTYYVVGQTVCRFVNNLKDVDLKCNAPSTGGSVANVNGIRSGDLDLGVAQSDVGFNAISGLKQFNTKFSDLRSVFSMHGEPLTIVARTDSNISNFSDLKNKKVNVGNPGSGQRATMETLMTFKGLDFDYFSLASELTSTEQSSALSDKNIDAFTIVTGHPSGLIQEATTVSDAKIIPVEGNDIDQLIKKYPYYAKTVIPGGLYKGNPNDINTYGVVATIVTDKDTPNDSIYAITKAVFSNLDRIKKIHPAFANLTAEKMISDGLSAPLHEGAKRYYKERGWIK